MACCLGGGGGSGDGEELEERRNQQIEKDLHKQSKAEDRITLLLLGAGESGKSTIFKQMQFMQKDYREDYSGLSQVEINNYRTVIFGNILGCMKTLLFESERLGVEALPDNADAAINIKDLLPDPNLWTVDVGRDIAALWQDANIRKTYSMRDVHFQLNDSAAYFFDNLERINQPGSSYTPTETDILRARIRSCGINEADFMFKKMSFRMVDVGGQRNERRKWVHCFDNVTAVLFCAALSEYDQVLREDGKTNRLKESIALFKDIVNSQWFFNKPMILFLNKKDLFQDKLQGRPFKDFWPSYEGENTYDDVCKFIEGLFKKVVKKDTPVYVHQTCAVNTDNIRFVFDSVRNYLVNSALQGSLGYE